MTAVPGKLERSLRHAVRIAAPPVRRPWWWRPWLWLCTLEPPIVFLRAALSVGWWILAPRLATVDSDPAAMVGPVSVAQGVFGMCVTMFALPGLSSPTLHALKLMPCRWRALFRSQVRRMLGFCLWTAVDLGVLYAHWADAAGRWPPAWLWVLSAAVLQAALLHTGAWLLVSTRSRGINAAILSWTCVAWMLTLVEGTWINTWAAVVCPPAWVNLALARGGLVGESAWAWVALLPLMVFALIPWIHQRTWRAFEAETPRGRPVSWRYGELSAGRARRRPPSPTPSLTSAEVGDGMGMGALAASGLMMRWLMLGSRGRDAVVARIFVDANASPGWWWVAVTVSALLFSWAPPGALIAALAAATTHSLALSFAWLLVVMGLGWLPMVFGFLFSLATLGTACALAWTSTRPARRSWTGDVFPMTLHEMARVSWRQCILTLLALVPAAIVVDTSPLCDLLAASASDAVPWRWLLVRLLFLIGCWWPVLWGWRTLMDCIEWRFWLSFLRFAFWVALLGIASAWVMTPVWRIADWLSPVATAALSWGSYRWWFSRFDRHQLP